MSLLSLPPSGAGIIHKNHSASSVGSASSSGCLASGTCHKLFSCLCKKNATTQSSILNPLASTRASAKTGTGGSFGFGFPSCVQAKTGWDLPESTWNKNLPSSQQWVWMMKLQQVLELLPGRDMDQRWYGHASWMQAKNGWELPGWTWKTNMPGSQWSPWMMKLPQRMKLLLILPGTDMNQRWYGHASWMQEKTGMNKPGLQTC